LVSIENKILKVSIKNESFLCYSLNAPNMTSQSPELTTKKVN